MEDQGIMALPQAGMPAPTTAPTTNPQSEAAIAAFDQARLQADPREFGNELLTAASQIDPAAVQEFQQALQALNLPPQVIDALNQMVDAILAEPQNYAEIRADFISEGVPEDLLPEEFDPNFFGALNLALDQMLGSSLPMTTQQFAQGGIATLNPIAQLLAAQGRNGDTMLAHITPAEARMLRRRGGSGTINPVTGLPEFFLKKVAKAVGKTFKSVGKTISKTVKNVGRAIKKFASSTVGRMVATIALGFFLGPAAASMLGVSSAAGVAAVSGFVGSAGSTLLAGGNVKDALRAGAVGGLTAGAAAGITGGMSAFQSGSYTGPTTVAGQVERFTDSAKALTGLGGTPSAPEVTGQLQYTGQGDVIPGPAGAPPMAPQIPADVIPQPATAGVTQAPSLTGQPATPPNLGAAPPPASSPGFFESPIQATKDFYQETIRPNIMPSGIEEAGRANALKAAEAAKAQATTTMGLSQQGVDKFVLDAYNKALPGTFAKYAPLVAGGTALASATGMFTPKQPEPPGLVPRTTGFDLYNQNPELYGVTPGGVNPVFAPPSTIPGYTAPPPSPTSPLEYGQMGSPLVAPTFQVRDPREYLAPMGIASLQPQGFAIGGLARKISGRGFGQAGNPPRGLFGRIAAQARQALLAQQQKQRLQQLSQPFTPGAAVSPPPSNVGNPVAGQTMSPPSFAVRQPSEYLPAGVFASSPQQFNMGGYAKGGGIRTLAQKYPRRTGQISGPGTETSDSIPAMLSDGEFVMTAKAVRGAGKGSRREGAKRMYAMMRKFERKA